jgi:hypothetical protein
MEQEEPKAKKRIQIREERTRSRRGGTFTLFMLIISALSVGTIYYVLRELKHVEVHKQAKIDPNVTRIKAANLAALSGYIHKTLQAKDIAADSLLENNDSLYLSKLIVKQDSGAAYLIVIKIQQDALANISYDTAKAVLKCKAIISGDLKDSIKARNHWPVLYELNDGK